MCNYKTRNILKSICGLDYSLKMSNLYALPDVGEDKDYFEAGAFPTASARL